MAVAKGGGGKEGKGEGCQAERSNVDSVVENGGNLMGSVVACENSCVAGCLL